MPHRSSRNADFATDQMSTPAGRNSRITNEGVNLGAANLVVRVVPNTDAGLTPGRRYS